MENHFHAAVWLKLPFKSHGFSIKNQLQDLGHFLFEQRFHAARFYRKATSQKGAWGGGSVKNCFLKKRGGAALFGRKLLWWFGALFIQKDGGNNSFCREPLFVEEFFLGPTFCPKSQDEDPLFVHKVRTMTRFSSTHHSPMQVPTRYFFVEKRGLALGGGCFGYFCSSSLSEPSTFVQLLWPFDKLACPHCLYRFCDNVIP